MLDLLRQALHPDALHPDALHPDALHPDDDTGASLPPSELRCKLYLTEDEAVEYTGLGRGYHSGECEGKDQRAKPVHGVPARRSGKAVKVESDTLRHFAGSWQEC
jgi:hypothetical protein